MEDNTLDFLNPLEPLGTPNDANLASNLPVGSENLGNELRDPQINFPKHYDASPLTYMETRENLVDSPGYKSNASEGTLKPEEILKSLGNMWKGNMAQDTVGAKRAKVYSYDNSADSGAFYKRYAAYGQEKFDKIGFSPLRDNEAVFNENTSMWNDFTRMMTHSWWPLFKQGFVAGPKSLYRAMQGDFGSDLEDAEIYAEAAAIGQSSKGGVSAFMSNAFMNFAYTAGIITESIAEMGAAALLAAPTGGGSLALTGANLGRKSLMLGRLNNLRKAGTLAPGIEVAATKAMNATQFTGALNNLKKIDNARTVFNWAKAEKMTGSALGRFINPFAELTEGILAGAKQSQNLTGWAKAMTIGRNTVGGLYRNVHTINAALAEARLEGGMVENSVYDKLYRSLTPEERENEDELKAIRTQAQAAGNKALIANVGVIYISNKIVFDNIYGGKGPISRLMNKRTQDIMDLKTGKLRIRKSGSKVAGQVIKKPVVEYTKNNFKNMLKDFVREPITKSARGALTYFKGNVMEGLQENAQEAIQEAAESYYIETFKNPDLATTQFAMSQIRHGIDEQFSAQGFETFMSGFVMGTFARPLNAAPQWASVGYNRIKDPAKYQEYINKRDNYGKQLAQTLNDVDVKDFYDNPIWNYSSQSQFNKRLFEATTEEEREAIHTEKERQNAFVSAMTIAMEKGVMDLYYEQIDSASQLTQEEFEEAYGLEKGQGKQYLENIQQIKERAQQVESRWNEAKELFPEPEDIGEILDNADPKSVEYEQAQLLLVAWKEARKNYVFFHESFTNLQNTMKDISNDITKLVNNMDLGSNNVRILFDKRLLKNEKGLLKSDVELLEGMENLTSEQKEELKEKKERLERLEELSNAILDFEKANLTKHDLLEQTKAALQTSELELSEEDLKTLAEGFYEQNRESIHEQYVQVDIALKKYFRHLLKDKDYEFKTSDVDDIVRKYTTYLEMDNQQKSMAKILNIVSDEQGYIDMVQRNMLWMKELYDRRKEFYEEFIQKGFENLENNDLLNILADQGVYISPEALTDWVENGVVPEEFFLQDQQVVIKEGHHLYDEYAYKFIMLSNSRKQPADITSKQYQDKIDKLNEQREAAINALPKTTVEEIKSNLEFKTPKTIDKFAEQIFNNQYARLTYTDGNGQKQTMTVYKNAEGDVFYDDENGNPFDDNTTKFESAELFIRVERPDQAEVDAINEQYDKLVAEVEGQMRAYKDKKGEAMSNITKDTPYSEMPQDLKDQLAEAYMEYAKSIGKPIPQDAQVAEDDIANFIQTNKLAGDIINKYNSEINALLEQPLNYDPVFIDNDGNERRASEFNKKQLKAIVKKLDQKIKDLEAKNSLEDSEKQELNQSIATKNELETYLKHIEDKNFTDIQIKVRNLFNEKVKALQEQIKTPNETNSDTYDVDGSKKTRVTNLTKDIKGDSFVNSELVELLNVFENTLKDKPLTKESIAEFKKEAKRFSSISKTNTLNALISELETLITEETDRVLTQEEFETLINKWQWQESRDAGTYIHAGIEALFNGGTIPFDSKIITEEVYEQLFGETGVIKNLIKDLQSKGLMLLGMESIVFDEQFAGSVDMLLVDPEGRIHIIDIKTGKQSKWESFNKKDKDSHDDHNKVSYSLQLGAYRALLTKMLGAKISMSTSVLPIQVEYNKDGTVSKAKLPTHISGLLTQGSKLINIKLNEKLEPLGKTAREAILEHINMSMFTPTASTPGVQVATDINPELKEKLINAGITEQVIAQMTKAEQEEFLSYTEAPERNEFINQINEKYSKQITDEIESEGPTDDEILDQMIATEEERNENINKINEVVRLLKIRKSKLQKDISDIKKDLEGLKSSVNLSNAQIDAITSKIEVLNKTINSNIEARKKSGVKGWLTRYKGQVKEEYSVLNDLVNRVKELSEDLEYLELLDKDYTNQINYYNNLLADPNYTTFSKEELTEKIKKLEKKASTVSKLISAIKRAIKNTLKYVAEYFNIANNYQKDIAKITAEKYNKEKLTSAEHESMLRDINQREVKINQAFEDAQFLEEVQENEEARLEELQQALSKYNDQIRYVKNLIEAIDVLDTEEVDKVKDASEPKPKATVPNPSEAITRNETKVKQAKKQQPKKLKPTPKASDKSFTKDDSWEGYEQLDAYEESQTFTLEELEGKKQSKEFNKLKKELKQSKDLDSALKILLSENVSKLSTSEVKQLHSLLKLKVKSLPLKSIKDAAPVTTIESVSVGDIIYNKETGQNFKVIKKDSKEIIVQNTNNKVSLSNENLKDYVMGAYLNMPQKTDIVKKENVTEEEKQSMKGTIDNVGNFLSNQQQLDDAVKEAVEKKLEKLDDDLLNDLNC